MLIDENILEIRFARSGAIYYYSTSRSADSVEGRCAGLAQEVESVSVKVRRAASFEQSLGRFQHYSTFSPILAMVVGGSRDATCHDVIVT
jgi:hypothetical protein